MIDDQRFEIQSAFDLLPHVVGCSWATIWFRLNKIKKPTREEFREKVTEYFKILDPLVNVYPQDKNFEEIVNYLKKQKISKNGKTTTDISDILDSLSV